VRDGKGVMVHGTAQASPASWSVSYDNAPVYQPCPLKAQTLKFERKPRIRHGMRSFLKQTSKTKTRTYGARGARVR
jgi:hypothetical protein